MSGWVGKERVSEWILCQAAHEPNLAQLCKASSKCRSVGKDFAQFLFFLFLFLFLFFFFVTAPPRACEVRLGGGFKRIQLRHRRLVSSQGVCLKHWREEDWWAGRRQAVRESRKCRARLILPSFPYFLHSCLTSSLTPSLSLILPFFLPSFLPSFLSSFLPFFPSLVPSFLPSSLPSFLPSFLPFFLPSFLLSFLYS